MLRTLAESVRFESLAKAALASELIVEADPAVSNYLVCACHECALFAQGQEVALQEMSLKSTNQHSARFAAAFVLIAGWTSTSLLQAVSAAARQVHGECFVLVLDSFTPQPRSTLDSVMAATDENAGAACKRLIQLLMQRKLGEGAMQAREGLLQCETFPTPSSTNVASLLRRRRSVGCPSSLAASASTSQSELCFAWRIYIWLALKHHGRSSMI